MLEEVLISKAELDRLQDVDRFMDALEEAGVDNWEGYEIACGFYNGTLDPEDY